MRVSWGYLKRLLAGATFGHYMAHLLYVLNPQIEITPARLGIVTVAYGVICGLLFGSILWGLHALRVRLFGRDEQNEERRHGLGLVVAAAFVSAAVYWLHLYLFRIYLPSGAVRILRIATNVTTATAFCLFLLWLVERNAGRRLSRALFVSAAALIALSAFFLYQRRESYRPDIRSPVVANIGAVAGKSPVIVVAIRDLPYDWLITAIGDSRLPFFQRVMDEGFLARVEPYPTTSRQSLWASLATGQLPHRHGVTGRYSFQTLLNAEGERFLILPSAVGFRAWGLIPPVKKISAQLPSGDSLPFWTMFERLGLPALVVNWPSALPREGEGTILVSDRFLERRGTEIHPSSLLAELERVRAETERRAVRLSGDVRNRDRVEAAVRLDLVAVRTLDQLLVRESFSLSVIALPALSVMARAIGVDGNRLPSAGTPEAAVIRRHLEEIDRLLEGMRSGFPQATIIVVSPSGPKPPTLPANPIAMLKSFQESQDPGSDDGVLAMLGGGIVQRERNPVARVVDVVPTILFAAGLPVARDMDGRVVTEAFGEPFLRENALSMIQTYKASRLIVHRAQ
ncbi:MAG TPA: alkaline phosphatase family protein [Thermoanaerobaculia bacterium]|nr:alkaline phosphatase family protein [Thermoanaerobaculia bacterium]